MNFKIDESAATIAATPDAVDGISTFGLFSQAKAQLVQALKARQDAYTTIIKNVRGMKEKEVLTGPQ